MNLNNYASLEASNRLVKAGIVLVTEAGWWRRNSWQRWSLGYRGLVEDDPRNIIIIPAPGMAEVWRELPATVPDRGLYVPMKLRKAGDGKTWGSHFRDGSQIIDSIKADINPTDALINLLIWLRKEASHER